MKKIPRGWSDQVTKAHCKSCNKKTAQEIIQYQNKINIGPIPIMGRGPRDFGKLCKCGYISPLLKAEISNAKKLKYYDKPSKTSEDKEEVISIKQKKRKKRNKYPVLNEKEREKIIKHNKKEGYLSIFFGIIIGVIIIVIVSTNGGSSNWGMSFMVIFTILGLYAAYEDPERKHRDLIRSGKKL